jgi:hypothetical protein
MAACKKYDQARLQCATAGNFKTCLQIKMDNDISYVDLCGGSDEGRPAEPLDPRHPTLFAVSSLTNDLWPLSTRGSHVRAVAV